MVISFLVFLFGLVVGSFLNCLIYRLETAEKGWLKKMIFGRSFCPHCHNTLAWYDLIPILSFVLLKGKCRYCREKISPQYPIVELATGAIFALIFNQSTLGIVPGTNVAGTVPATLFYLFIAACLIAIFVFDLKHYIIPDEIVYPAVVISGIWYLASRIVPFYTKYKVSAFGGPAVGWQNIIYSAFGAALFFFLIYIITRGKGMGFGDVKLGFLMGLFLGFPNILVALFFAFLSGAIIGVFLMAFRKKTLKSELPFGPFLVFGVFFALFFGQSVVNYYLTSFLGQ